MNIYWEPQRGDNCRIHSLNAMFGKQIITDEIFKELCDSYDKLIPGLKSINMDGFAECRSIISYIVDIYTNQYTLLIPINLKNINKSNRDFFDYSRYLSFLGKEITQYFEFNKGHVWFNIYKNNRWYKVDSLSGVNQIDRINSFGENGYLVIFSQKMIFLEIEYIIGFVKSNCKNNLEKLNENLEIILYNLYHLLSKIKLEYSRDSCYNKKMSILRQIKKSLVKFIDLNRKLYITKALHDQIMREIMQLIILF